ncbi:hypothetical protein AURDEDRAFT_130273 [Auricularia subglabra TFB-10046 SS5]|nr:hypothetical protein AURDEDRAFT_130273 [Auricularia subglabra TFB-10046 SS5]
MPNSSFDTERLSLFINGILVNKSDSTAVQSAGNASRRRRVIHSIPGRRVREGAERRVPEPQRVVIPEPCVAQIEYIPNLPEPCTAEIACMSIPEAHTAEVDYFSPFPAEVVYAPEEDAARPQRRSSFREAMIREGVLMPIPGCSMLINPVLYDAHMRRMQADAIRDQPSRAQLMLEDIRKNGINSERFKGLRRDTPDS